MINDICYNVRDNSNTVISYMTIDISYLFNNPSISRLINEMETLITNNLDNSSNSLHNQNRVGNYPTYNDSSLIDLQISSINNNNLNRISRPNNIFRINYTFPINYANLFANNNSLNNYNTNIENVIQSSFEDKPEFKKITKEEIINNLETVIYKKNNSSIKNSSCPIYYIDFDDGDELIRLPCSHCFVPEAIRKWLSEESNECPVCRHELDFNEIRSKKNNTTNNDDTNNNTTNNDDTTNNFNNTTEYPILENNDELYLSNQQQIRRYRREFYSNIQNMIDRIYSSSPNTNITSNLENHISSSNYNETDNSEDNEDDDESNSNYNSTRTNPRDIYISRLRSNFYNQFSSIYQEQLYEQDLEEAIARSLEEQ